MVLADERTAKATRALCGVHAGPRSSERQNCLEDIEEALLLKARSTVERMSPRSLTQSDPIRAHRDGRDTRLGSASDNFSDHGGRVREASLGCDARDSSRSPRDGAAEGSRLGPLSSVALR